MIIHLGVIYTNEGRKVYIVNREEKGEIPKLEYRGEGNDPWNNWPTLLILLVNVTELKYEST